jgi:hypothetical protein
MYCLSKGGNKTDFWGRYTPMKKDPFFRPIYGAIAWKLLIIVVGYPLSDIEVARPKLEYGIFRTVL